MKTRRLAAGLPEVGLIGLGGMSLSIQGRPDPARAEAVVHAALDAGVTLIDTADVYCLDDRDIGHNERLIARALQSWPGDRDRILVATKGGLTRPEGRWVPDGRPDRLRQACEKSLAALGTETIGLYQLHAPDPAVPFEDSVGALADLRTEGKIRWVGLSNVSEAQIRLAQAIVPVATVQNRLSVFDRSALGDGVLEYCGRQGIGFLAYSPVGGRRMNETLGRKQPVREIAARTGRSFHQVALAWVLAQGPTVFAIPGTANPDHARECAGAADLDLGDLAVSQSP